MTMVTEMCALRMASSAIWLAWWRYLTRRSKVYWQQEIGMRLSRNLRAVASDSACAGVARPASARTSSSWRRM